MVVQFYATRPEVDLSNCGVAQLWYDWDNAQTVYIYNSLKTRTVLDRAIMNSYRVNKIEHSSWEEKRTLIIWDSLCKMKTRSELLKRKRKQK